MSYLSFSCHSHRPPELAFLIMRLTILFRIPDCLQHVLTCLSLSEPLDQPCKEINHCPSIYGHSEFPTKPFTLCWWPIIRQERFLMCLRIWSTLFWLSSLTTACLVPTVSYDSLDKVLSLNRAILLYRLGNEVFQVNIDLNIAIERPERFGCINGNPNTAFGPQNSGFNAKPKTEIVLASKTSHALSWLFTCCFSFSAQVLEQVLINFANKEKINNARVFGLGVVIQ